MARHIQQFDIEAYRGIHNMKLKNLNDINILTGDNNSGKTSVLEVISSMRDPYSIKAWTGMILNRFSSAKKSCFIRKSITFFRLMRKKNRLDTNIWMSME